MIGGVSSRNRITGLATGMDIDEVVKGMMMREQAKIDKIYQDKTLLEFRQEEYRDIIKGMKEFQKYFNPTSDKYLSKSKFMTTTAKASDDKYFKVSASGSAKNGTYKVEVGQLAESAKVEGNTLGGVLQKGDTIKISYSAGGTAKDIEVRVDASGNLVDNAAAPIGGITELKEIFNIKEYDKNGEKFYKLEPKKTEIAIDSMKVEVTRDINGVPTTNETNIGSINESTTLESLGFAPKGDNYELNIKVNGVEKNIVVNATNDDGTKATIKDLADAISKGTDGEVKLNLDKTLNKISLESTKTGTNQSIEVVDGGLATDLGLSGKPIGEGKDAKVTIEGPDGLKTTVTNSTNSINEMGLDLNLKSITETGKSIEITVDKTGGIDETMKTIKSFIDDYNAIMTTINKKLAERTNFKYKPLTEEQMEDMSEGEIKKWNEKVKQGILRNDPLLSALQKDLKGIFGDSIEGVNAKMGKYGEVSFGLDFSSDASNPGIIEVDEEKLKAALESKPDAIVDFFTKSSSKTVEKDKPYKGSEKYKNEGILNRMNQIMRDYVGIPGIGEDGKGSMSGSMNIQVNKQYDYSYTGGSSKNTIPDQIYRQQMSMDKLQKKYYEKQEQLYIDFSRLETSMNKLNSQMNYLMSQLG